MSVFMQELKKRFAWWYNKRVGRKGPLWEDRFKSVLELTRIVSVPINLLIISSWLSLVSEPNAIVAGFRIFRRESDSTRLSSSFFANGGANRAPAAVS